MDHVMSFLNLIVMIFPRVFERLLAQIYLARYIYLCEPSIA